MARKAHPPFILHLHPQNTRFFQQLIEEVGEEKKERDWRNNLEH
jgi:hypothetical protein